MWAILVVTFLCTQIHIYGKNRPENAKTKFHAQNQTVLSSEQTNRPRKWAETLGNLKSITNMSELEFTKMSIDHNPQQANVQFSLWPHKTPHCIKTYKNYISTSTDNDLASQFFPQGQLYRNALGVTKIPGLHPRSTFCKKTTPSVFSLFGRKWTINCYFDEQY